MPRQSSRAVRPAPPGSPMPPRPSGRQAALVVLRNAVPLAVAIWTQGPTGQFLVLSLFNAVFGAVAIATVGAAVSMRQERGPATAVSPWRTFAVAAAVGLTIAVGIASLFGWFVAAMFPDDVLVPSTAWSSLAIAVAAMPGLSAQYRADLGAGSSEPARKRRDQPAIMALILSAFAVSLLCLFAIDLGRHARLPLMFAVTLAFVLRDLRPDLVGRLLPPAEPPPSSR